MTSAASKNPMEPAGGAGAQPRRNEFDSVRGTARRCLTCDREPAAGELMTAVLVELTRRGAGGGEFQRLDYCPDCWPGSPWADGADALLDEGQSAVGGDIYGSPPVAVWTVRAAVRQKRRRTFVDDTVLMNFFLRLADEGSPTDYADYAESREVVEPGPEVLGGIPRASSPSPNGQTSSPIQSVKSEESVGNPAMARRQFRFVLMLILLRHRKLRHEGTERLAGGDAWQVRLMPAMAQSAGTPPEQVYPVIDPRMNDLQVEQVAQQLSQILQEDIDTVSQGEPT